MVRINEETPGPGPLRDTDWKEAEKRARAAYHDPAYPPRPCDACGTIYTGPAVYCSLDCALADA